MKFGFVAGLVLIASMQAALADVRLLNVSYDVTREFYNPVSVVDNVADKRGTRKVAQAHLEFLYKEKGQELAAKHYFRPRDPKVLARHQATFSNLELFTVDEVFGGWKKAQVAHFNDGGSFDQIYQVR